MKMFRLDHTTEAPDPYYSHTETLGLYSTRKKAIAAMQRASNVGRKGPLTDTPDLINWPYFTITEHLMDVDMFPKFTA
jgi:hypothetical protein